MTRILVSLALAAALLAPPVAIAQDAAPKPKPKAAAATSPLPKVGKDCDAFYHDAFLSSADGYSAIEADLGAIATKAGLRTTSITFSQKEVKDRGVTLVTVLDYVDGDYPAIIQFINGLERSKYFYLLNDLHLDTATAGAIRLHLELRTYFRT